MNDMLGTEMAAGDIVLFPGGSARYGGLKMQSGIVIKFTKERVTILTGDLISDKFKFKTSNKASKSLLVVIDRAVSQSPVIAEMKKQLIEALLKADEISK